MVLETKQKEIQIGCPCGLIVPASQYAEHQHAPDAALTHALPKGEMLESSALAATILQSVEAKAPPLSPADNRTAKSGGRSKGNDGYLTPDSFLGVLSKMGAIELDPAGSEAESFIWPSREYRLDRGEDGLALSWKVKLGSIVFCNPPYSETRKWIEKADVEHAQHLSEIFLLVAARTETIAMQASKARFVCFWKGRITFVDPATKKPPTDANGKPAGAMFPSCVLYYGIREARFREVFEPFGKVVRWGCP
jgi:hypothetical protein